MRRKEERRQERRVGIGEGEERVECFSHTGKREGESRRKREKREKEQNQQKRRRERR